MSETRFPDIEIYLRGASMDAVMDWLRHTFPDGAFRIRGRTDQALRLDLGIERGTIPVTLVEDALPGYTAAWFDSPHTPWASDLECARSAAAYLGCEVRCSTGGWAEGDAEEWWCLRGGREQRIRWR